MDRLDQVKTVFLDAGGVLVNPSWERVSTVLATEGVEVSAAALRAAEAPAKRDIDHAAVIGATDDAKRGWLYFNKVLEYAGVPLSEATDAALAMLRAYHQRENLWEEVLPGVPEALAELREREVTLVVVSNANGRLRYLFDRLDLTRWFDVVLDSHEWGVEKPDAELFRIALREARADAVSTIHVGDLFHIDVAGARAAGLREGILVDVAGLYPDADCRRVAHVREVAGLLR